MHEIQRVHVPGGYGLAESSVPYGIFGMALNGVPFLLYHVDAGGKPHGLALDFDDCSGHIERASLRYHYHGPPVCSILLKLFGQQA